MSAEPTVTGGVTPSEEKKEPAARMGTLQKGFVSSLKDGFSFIKTYKTVSGVLKSAGASKVPLIVTSTNDWITAASNSLSNNVVLIFTVIKGYQANRLDQEVPEFKIDDLFDVPGVKTVARGLVTQGIIVENMPLNIGPFEEGSSKTVSSIKWHKAFSRDVDISLQSIQPIACQYLQVTVTVDCAVASNIPFVSGQWNIFVIKQSTLLSIYYKLTSFN